jgi:phospholipase D1/2
MMIVDDVYIILGSANINERSMAGNRDTEIAIGGFQPTHMIPVSLGKVHQFRMSLWAEHLGESGEYQVNPERSAAKVIF